MKKALFIIVIIIFLFALQEIVFRIIFPMPEISNFNRINYSPTFFTAQEADVKYLSNASFLWTSEPDKAESKIDLNLYGFRDLDWNIEKSKDKPRVLFIGDSFVEGFLASQDSTIPTAFSDKAYGDYYDIEVMNLGIGGNNFNGYFELIRDARKIFIPDVIFLIINSNDFPVNDFKEELLNDEISIEYNNFFQPRIINVLSKYSRSIVVPHFWYSTPFQFFAPVPSMRNPWSMKNNSNEWKNYVEPNVEKAMRHGLFNPFSVNEYDKYKKNLLEPINIIQHIVALRNFSDKYSCKINVAYIPSRSQVSNNYLSNQTKFTKTKSPTSLMAVEYQLHAKLIKESCEQFGLSFFDFTPAFRKSEISGNRLYWNYDEHLNSKGYTLAGQLLFDWWSKLENSK